MSSKKSPAPQQPSNGKQILLAQSQGFAGPLPPPEMLKGYEDTLPGVADRIVSLAEKQSEHRRKLETGELQLNFEIVKTERRKSYLGTICGFIVVMTCIILGAFLIINGKESGGISSIISSLAALVGVFYFGKKKEDK